MSSTGQINAPGDERRRSLSKFIRRASRVLRPMPREESSTSVTTPGFAPTTSEAQASPAAAMPERQDSPLTVRATPPPAETVPEPAPATAAASTPTRSNTTTLSPKNVSLATDNPRPVTIPRGPVKDITEHNAQQREKAQALFAKYGLMLEARDWTIPLSSSTRKEGAGVEWVDRKVRMRVHRECHHCRTSFGSDRTCANCSHTRCKKCPRFPMKKSAGEQQQQQRTTEELAQVEREMAGANLGRTTQSTAVASGGGVEKSTGRQVDLVAEAERVMRQEKEQGREADKENVVPGDIDMYMNVDPIEQNEKLRDKHLKGVSQRRGREVVYRPAMCRVRRRCHKCEALFKGRATTCEGCGHTRCPNCPREPAKPLKFPSGYPGDVVETVEPEQVIAEAKEAEQQQMYPALERVWRKPRVRVRYFCDKCDAVFASSSQKVCASCKHERCDSCVREPARRVVKQHPDELLRGLEGKMVGLRLLPGAGGAEEVLETVE